MTFYLHSTFVTSSLAWLISWLPLLLVISSCVWILSDVAGESTNEEWPQLFDPLASPILIMMPGGERKGRRTTPFIVGMSLILILAAGVGISLGYGVRDHQLVAQQYTYTDVTVLHRTSDREFIIWPVRMKQQHVQICPNSTVAWYEGEILDDWTFEQRDGCKRVISYHEKLKGEINASVQTR